MADMMIGLTGGYCAGKNLAAKALEAEGFACADVDRMGHEALALSRDAVAAAFGSGVLAPDGSVDRRSLGALVFADYTALARLESITHPVMFALLDSWIDGNGGRPLCLNAFTLYRMPHAAACDAILEVRAPLALRVARGMARDGLSPAAILRRIASQRATLELGANFPRVTRLSNGCGAEAFSRRVRAFAARVARMEAGA